MLELLSLLGGGVFRLLPEVIGFFNKKADADHEYKMTQLQLEIDKGRASQALDLAHINNDAAQSQADLQALSEALKGQSTPTGIKWIDGLSSSVRPVLTYWWCLGLYTASKAILAYLAWKAGTDLAGMAKVILTEFDYNIVASMISFWFVDRAIVRNKGK